MARLDGNPVRGEEDPPQPCREGQLQAAGLSLLNGRGRKAASEILPWPLTGPAVRTECTRHDCAQATSTWSCLMDQGSSECCATGRQSGLTTRIRGHPLQGEGAREAAQKPRGNTTSCIDLSFSCSYVLTTDTRHCHLISRCNRSQCAIRTTYVSCFRGRESCLLILSVCPVLSLQRFPTVSIQVPS